MKPLISAAQLAAIQNNVVLIDARSGPQARTHFAENHLDGARFADLETDLSGDKTHPEKGGRHPLPSPEAFAKTLGNLGISPQSHVVVYDDKSGASAAARFWWMLRSIGHQTVQVLDGGLQAAVAAGLPQRSGAQTVAETHYPALPFLLPQVNISEVAHLAPAPESVVIDVREGFRYRGESEPIDPVAGHIPGAVNMPFAQNLDAHGLFKNPEELRTHFAPVLANRTAQNTVVHCGSGVTACHTALAMDAAGLGIPTVYIGSWSEWCRSNRPMATGSK